MRINVLYIIVFLIIQLQLQYLDAQPWVRVPSLKDDDPYVMFIYTMKAKISSKAGPVKLPMELRTDQVTDGYLLEIEYLEGYEFRAVPRKVYMFSPYLYNQFDVDEEIYIQSVTDNRNKGKYRELILLRKLSKYNVKPPRLERVTEADFN